MMEKIPVKSGHSMKMWYTLFSCIKGKPFERMGRKALEPKARSAMAVSCPIRGLTTLYGTKKTQCLIQELGIVFFLLIVLAFGLIGGISWAAQNEVQGSVSALGKNYISVTYKSDTAKGVEYDMMLPFDANVKLEHKSNLKEFSVGDIVKVTFEDATEGQGDKAVLKRKAKVISFVSPAPVATPGPSGE